ncbi:hypothetical protein [Shouchella hunanensis]|uniref:SMODS and SLOG-associating 2TM effector domain-containing protein n=1 Tax=Shouchella hunanensis TaxID=766894 RepID=A0ABY7W644_9BACI|nr:hypothetical protein [Shouchella hunanensis]WDF02966.1 hypothetical protein PQ477_15885 [Shouchella hunanensis]
MNRENYFEISKQKFIDITNPDKKAKALKKLQYQLVANPSLVRDIMIGNPKYYHETLAICKQLLEKNRSRVSELLSLFGIGVTILAILIALSLGLIDKGTIEDHNNLQVFDFLFNHILIVTAFYALISLIILFLESHKERNRMLYISIISYLESYVDPTR